MIKIPGSVHDEMTAHAAEGYPNEICGLMLGSTNGDCREVKVSHRAKNLNADRAHDRYDLDPKDYLAADKLARENGWDIVGFYHSHPDHPAKPSQTDRDAAWPGYSYVIIKVENGTPKDVNSFVLPDEESPFDDEELVRT